VYYTIPTTEGFLPIKSTLPSGTYIAAPAKIRKRKESSKTSSSKCKTFHKTVTAVSTATVTSTVTNTLTGAVLVFPDESTAYEYDTYTFPTTYIIYSATTTEYTTAVSTATATANTTVTVNATTATVHAACATDNFASNVILSNGTVLPIVSLSWDFPLDATGSASDCCEAALGVSAVTWAYAYGSICVVTTHSDGNCVQNENTQVAGYSDKLPPGQVVVGNGYCGEINSAVPTP
jgi:hypothetical protein